MQNNPKKKKRRNRGNFKVVEIEAQDVRFGVGLRHAERPSSADYPTVRIEACLLGVRWTTTKCNIDRSARRFRQKPSRKPSSHLNTGCRTLSVNVKNLHGSPKTTEPQTMAINQRGVYRGMTITEMTAE